MRTNLSFSNTTGAKWALLLSFGLGVSTAQAETVNCTAITSLPTTITTGGSYCLTGNISTSISSGNAIEIQADNVVIDLNGFYIDNTAAGTSQTAYGIASTTAGNSPITVRNGTVKGFFRGVYLNSGTSPTTLSNVVEDMRITNSWFNAIYVHGHGSVIRRNMILHTGNPDTEFSSVGIKVDGKGYEVQDNLVFNTFAIGTASATGIEAFSYGAAELRNNVISQTSADNAFFETGVQSIADYATIRDNFVLDSNTGFHLNSGDKYIGNLTRNTLTPFGGVGTAVGYND